MPNETNHGPICIGLDNGCPDCTRMQAASFAAAQQQPPTTLLDFDCQMTGPFEVVGELIGRAQPLADTITTGSVLDAIELGLADESEKISAAAWSAIQRRLRTLFSRTAGRS